MNGASSIRVGEEYPIFPKVLWIHTGPIGRQRRIMACHPSTYLTRVNGTCLMILCRSIALAPHVFSDLTRQRAFCCEPTRSRKFGVVPRVFGNFRHPCFAIKGFVRNDSGTFRSCLLRRNGNCLIFLTGPSPDLFRSLLLVFLFFEHSGRPLPFYGDGGRCRGYPF